MGLKGANFTTDLEQNDRLCSDVPINILALQLWPILDCSVQQSMEGTTASSFY